VKRWVDNTSRLDNCIQQFISRGASHEDHPIFQAQPARQAAQSRGVGSSAIDTEFRVVGELAHRPNS
jgi:hypothetical protein